MWKALKWLFIGWVLLLILSDVQISTSLYKYDDNKVVVSFPRWQAGCRIAWGRILDTDGQKDSLLP